MRFDDSFPFLFRDTNADLEEGHGGDEGKD